MKEANFEGNRKVARGEKTTESRTYLEDNIRVVLRERDRKERLPTCRSIGLSTRSAILTKQFNYWKYVNWNKCGTSTSTGCRASAHTRQTA